MTLKKSLVGGICLSISPLLLNALSLPALALVVRQLGADAYGQWTTASALIASLAMLASLGLRGAFIRHLASHPQELRTALAEQLGTRLSLSALAAAIGLLFAWLLGYPHAVLACVAVCGLSMVLTAAASTFVDVLQAMHRSSSIAAMSLISGLGLTVLSVVASLAGGGPVAIAASYCAGPLLLLVFALRACRRECEIGMDLHPATACRLLRRARAFAAQQLLNTAAAHAESILLPRIIGLTQFGFFNAGTLLSTRLLAIPDGLCTAAYPVLSSRFKRDRAAGAKLAARYGLIITLAALLIAMSCAAVSGWFAQLLFPSQPALCQTVILISIWALPLAALDASIGYALNAAHEDAAHARALAPAALCNIVITVFLMLQLGIVGACIAMPVRHLVRITVLSYCCIRIWMRDSAETGALAVV